MRTVLLVFSVAAAVCSAIAAPATAAPLQAAGRAGEPRPQETGILDVSSDPPARIVIDDHDTGKVTPQHRIELPVGHHTLTLVTQDGSHKRSIGFNIRHDQPTQLTLHLKS